MEFGHSDLAKRVAESSASFSSFEGEISMKLVRMAKEANGEKSVYLPALIDG